MSADGWIIPLARLPLHKTGSNNKNPVITRFLEGQLGPRTRFHSSAQTDRMSAFLSAANVLHSWLHMFGAAKGHFLGPPRDPGTPGAGAIVRPRRKFCVFHQRARPQSPPASTGSADEPGGHAHPDILTRAQGPTQPSWGGGGGSARRHGVPGFSGLQLQAKSQG